MKYPKPWEAGMPAGKSYVASSSREGPRKDRIQLGTYVNRPGTPDHTRLVRTWLTVAEATDLRDELAYHIDEIKRRETTAASAAELERQKREGVGVFDPKFVEDDCREAQDNTPSLGPFKS